MTVIAIPFRFPCSASTDDSGILPKQASQRKYIYGPGIDQPVSMIEVADSGQATTYYYHFDALGSVVALSDSAGDTVQTYEYSVYGEVAVEDANHTDPYMFAGRRYDLEIGLYYNPARYYNPFMGRFLQTDPIGYEAGMNLYRYCMNNPINMTDPSGLLVDGFSSTKYSRAMDIVYPDVPPDPAPWSIPDPVDFDVYDPLPMGVSSPIEAAGSYWVGSYCYIAGLVGLAYGFVYDDCVYLCIDFYKERKSGDVSVRGCSIKVYNKWVWLGGICPVKLVIKPPSGDYKDPYGRVYI